MRNMSTKFKKSGLFHDLYITCIIGVYTDAMGVEGVEVQVSPDLQLHWSGFWVQQIQNVDFARFLR